jgi:tRNA pseudouridine55 synthase
MNGFLNINKPKDITSFGVVKHIREVLKVKKAGHAGNLDPNATGVLVLGTGKATKFLPFVVQLEKEYVATVKFGLLTDTLDSTGEVLMHKDVPKLERKAVEEVLKEFVGEIDQVPPSYSALKFQGKRLYELAREGVLVSSKPKRVIVRRIELMELEEDELTLRVTCSKGTYLRSLARDLGERLGTLGIIQDLVRMKVGHFTLKDAVPMDDPGLAEKIIPLEQGLTHMPEVYITDRAGQYFRHGNRIGSGGMVGGRPSGIRSFQHVRVFDESGAFLGIGLLKHEGLHPKRVIPE